MFQPNQLDNQVTFEGQLKPKKKKKWLLLIVVILFLIFALATILLYPAVVNGYRIYTRVNDIKSRIEPAMITAQEGDLSSTRNALKETREDLIYVNERMSKLGVISLLPQVRDKLSVADHLLKASIKLLGSFDQIIGMISLVDMENTDMDNVVNQIGLGNDKKEVLKAIRKNSNNFEKISKDLDEAKEELALITSNDLMGKYGSQLAVFYKSISEIVKNSQMALPLLEQLPEILGEGQEKTYLLLFQNNMEMRATGGFIGSYAILKIKDGEIVSMAIDDIYNLDKHSKDKLNAVAPAPIQTYIKQKYWFMRDSNWWPDWPTSARQIAWFFNAERKFAGLPYENIDGVIGITPDFIADLLLIAGEIEIYGKKFKAENFTMDLEMFVEFDYEKEGIPIDQRKSIIGTMAEVLLKRMQNMPPSSLINLWTLMSQSMDEKHILLYFHDEEVQKYFSEQNWSGAIAQTDYDYIMAVDSNLAALKTDSVMDKTIKYKVKENTKGELEAELTLGYRHTGKYVKDIISIYRDYLRVYIPAGARIKKVKILEDNKEQILKPEEILTYSESGKSVAAVFFTVDFNKQKYIVLEYDLPSHIRENYKNGMYKLFVQKQPGTSGHKTEIDLEFNRNISAYDYLVNPVILDRHNINWKTDLRKDRIFSIKF